jgi:hypothetical protein
MKNVCEPDDRRTALRLIGLFERLDERTHGAQDGIL